MKDKEIIVKLAEQVDLNSCVSILEDSDLGAEYFVNKNGESVCEFLLNEAILKQEIYKVSLDNEEIIGFYWIEFQGMFKWFPYLHVVAVRSDLRGKGYGSKIFTYVEEYCLQIRKSDRIFLIVGEKNKRASAMYEKRGYQKIGSIPELFLDGIAETLMMKLLS